MSFMCMEKMCPHEFKNIFPYNHDYSFRALIWNGTRTYDDMKFCREAKSIIGVDKWLDF